MSHWTDDEIRELVALWPTNSAKVCGLYRRATTMYSPGRAGECEAEGGLLWVLVSDMS